METIDNKKQAQKPPDNYRQQITTCVCRSYTIVSTSRQQITTIDNKLQLSTTNYKYENLPATIGNKIQLPKILPFTKIDHRVDISIQIKT